MKTLALLKLLISNGKKNALMTLLKLIKRKKIGRCCLFLEKNFVA